MGTRHAASGIERIDVDEASARAEHPALGQGYRLMKRLLIGVLSVLTGVVVLHLTTAVRTLWWLEQRARGSGGVDLWSGPEPTFRVWYSEFWMRQEYWSVVSIIAGIVAYAILVRWFSQRQEDEELRCRKCRHILRGLSQPRCPECGDWI